jgi:hypothetical protein
MVSAAPTRLEAGPLSCVLDGADIRDLRVGNQRILTRLYIAVRDEGWNTIPFRFTQQVLVADGQQFQVRLECTVDQPPIRAEWEATVGGTADGEFSYALRGQFLSHFRFAKLGLNLHHPLPENIGARYVARRDSQTATGTVPSLIEPQFFIDGKLTGMFMPYDELVLQSSAGDEIVFHFSGDEFEMQDHRNWTDYNLKSYGTPLEVPLPLSAEPGQAIGQSVVIDLGGARGLHESAGTSSDRSAGNVSIDRSLTAQLPRTGSEFPAEVGNLGRAAAGHVVGLSLNYVRLDLDLTSEEIGAAAMAKGRQVNEWGLPLELVAVVSAGAPRPEELARLGRWLADLHPRVERVVVLEAPRGFYIGRTTSPGDKVRAYRQVVEEHCGPVVMVSATEQFFAELNRAWPELAGVDGVGYTICPQVHAADDTSIMENSWGQADTVLTARARSGGRPVHVTSVAMIGKFGPYPGGVPDIAVRSSYGDPRQHELFGAAWTVSSLRQLVDAEAASATYFELAGDRGLVRTGADGDEAAPVPVYRVLETVLSWRSGNIVRVGQLYGADLVGLGAEWADRSELLVANLGSSARQVELDGLAGEVTELSELTNDPSGGAAWAELSTTAEPSQRPGTVAFTTGPYGVVRVRTS